MSEKIDFGTELAGEVRDFVRDGFTPHFGELDENFPTNPLWRRMREIGSELWLDTGNIDNISGLWTREFTALTTNNSLLNKEVQTGAYDDLIREAAGLLKEFDLDEQQWKLEMAFILNARHGLKLVEKFDARVSVEQHTDLAFDVRGAVEYARRYYEICPERFYVKIPFTPAGLIATRQVSADIPINHTLGFAARQNYLIASVGRPKFVNVFLGRLNSFVADNDLGSGDYVGEKATLASQRAVRELRDRHDIDTRQIAASLRNGEQVRNLAGVDVLTIPPKVAHQFLELGLDPESVTDRTGEDYTPAVNDDVDIEAVRIDTLWRIGERTRKTVDELAGRDLSDQTPESMIEHFRRNACGDMLFGWSDEEIEISRAEGKIPRLENWKEGLGGRHIGLDTLMNLAGLNHFAIDQEEMDARVRDVLK